MMRLNIMKKEFAASPAANNHEAALPEGLKKTCADFESIFLTQMLKSMRAGFSGVDPLGNSHESQLLYGMLDEKLSEEIADSGGIGLATMMIEQLQARR